MKRMQIPRGYRFSGTVDCQGISTPALVALALEAAIPPLRAEYDTGNNSVRWHSPHDDAQAVGVALYLLQY